MKKKIFILILVGIFVPVFPSHALDTDLYVASAVDIPPNVLIILDNSASMNNVISGAQYDPNFTYPHVISEYPNMVYYQTKQGWNSWRDLSQVVCDAARSALSTDGNYRGKVNLGTSNCGGNNEEFATGNYLNYLYATGGPGNIPRFGLAKGIIHSYINTTDNVRFGVMIFNYKDGGKILYPISNTWETQHKTGIYQALAGLHADTYTPLAETLFEAGLYFKGENSLFNLNAEGKPIKYTSPVQYWCQKNYIILITDGEPTKDILDFAPDNGIRTTILNTIGEKRGDLEGDRDGDGLDYGPNARQYDMEGSDYLDDVAMYLNQDIDLSPQVDYKTHPQNVTIYTVGFTWNSPLLQDTAKNGGGKYFYAHNAQSFVIALQSIIAEILEKSVSYVAPVVPISQLEKTSSGNRMYLAMFKPTFKSFWKGNIKKYGLATKNDKGQIIDGNGNVVTDPNVKVGDILDADGKPVIEENKIYKDGQLVRVEYRIKDDARSYWSETADGGDVEKGGVGEKLWEQTTLIPNRPTSRNIYTYMGTNTNLKDSSNHFILTNNGITPEKLGLDKNDSAGRDKVIYHIHGLDPYNENGNYDVSGNPITNEKRDWILGAFIHSRPYIVHYPNKSVIYAGANDGMLHAFDDETGEELWAFIPPSLLPRLKNLNGEVLEFYVDGAPKVFKTAEKTILLFGLRRGGDRYIALDITDYNNPKFLWEISPSAIRYENNITNTMAYKELGQSWSTPQLGKIRYGSEDKWVAFIGGGYDEVSQDLENPGTDTKGRAIYVIDVLNGNLIWSYSNANNSKMKYCIPSDIARVDTDGNGKIDRLYVGDIGGQIWRFDIGDSNPSNWQTKIIFDANSGEIFKRKIFYPPDVTLEKGNYEMLFFGTGDREHPKDTTRINRLYAIKDKNLSTILTENDLADVTEDWLQEGDQTQKDYTLNELQTKQGWFIKLNQNSGEKSLSTSVVFLGTVYYTTFTPTPGVQNDPCFVGEGAGRLYALKYTTGNAAFNLDGLGTMANLTRSDRSTNIGSAIPSGIILTFIGGTSVAYGGTGGGVYQPPVPISKTIIPVRWRIVF